MKFRRYSSKLGGLGAGVARQAAQFAHTVDSKGNLTRVRIETDPPVGLLGRLLARSPGQRQVSGVPVPDEVVKAMQTVEDYVAGLDGEGRK